MSEFVTTKGLWVKAGVCLLIELADYEYEVERKYSLIKQVKETLAFHQIFVNIKTGMYA